MCLGIKSVNWATNSSQGEDDLNKKRLLANPLPGRAVMGRFITYIVHCHCLAIAVVRVRNDIADDLAGG